MSFRAISIACVALALTACPANTMLVPVTDVDAGTAGDAGGDAGAGGVDGGLGLDAGTDAGSGLPCALGAATALVFPGPAQCPTAPVGSGVVRAVALTGTDAPDAGVFRTVGYALGLAKAGDVIVIADGVYREGIESKAGGTATAPITIRAAAGAHPVITGSVEVTQWALDHGEIYSTPWNSAQLGPEGCSGPECSLLPRGAPQQVFVDGQPLQQLAGATVHPACPSATVDWCREVVGSSIADLDTHPGSFFFDSAAMRLFIRLANHATPSGHLVEVSLHRRVLFFYPDSSGNVCVEGLTFRHSNASAAYKQMAAVSLLGGSVLSNSIVEDADLAGVSTAGTVVQSIIRRNGQLGIAGSGPVRIEASEISGNNCRHFNPYWEAGGMKLVTNQSASVEGCHVFDNDGPGIWLDGSVGSPTEFVTVSRNWVHGNGREGQVMVEVSSQAWVVNNLVLNEGRVADENVRGIYVSESTNVLVAFNTVVSTAPAFAFDALSGTRGQIDGLRMVGNVFAMATATSPTHANVRIATPATWQSDRNDFFDGTGFSFQYDSHQIIGLEAWRTSAGQDASSIDLDPRLLDLSHGDFRPSANTPAIAVVPSVPVDFAGRFRNANTRLGAVEFCTQ